jgi:hypothetical protein
VAKKRATEKGIAFDLRPEDITIPERCPVFGIPLIAGKGVRTDNSPTIDRINNDKGYIRGNIIVVSWKANCLKRNFTVEDIRRVADFYENLEAT